MKNKISVPIYLIELNCWTFFLTCFVSCDALLFVFNNCFFFSVAVCILCKLCVRCSHIDTITPLLLVTCLLPVWRIDEKYNNEKVKKTETFSVQTAAQKIILKINNDKPSTNTQHTWNKEKHQQQQRKTEKNLYIYIYKIWENYVLLAFYWFCVMNTNVDTLSKLVVGCQWR